MKKVRNIERTSRRCLADQKLGLSYKDRLKKSSVEVITTGFKVHDQGNGYSRLIQKGN